MRRLVLVLALVSVAVSGAAAAALQPGRTVANPSTISALGVTFGSVVYAVRESNDAKRCAYVVLWDTSRNHLWRLGESTTRVCTQGPSTGSGISQVATSGRRVYWVTYVGGNFRDETLWTATPTRRAPRRLADATSEVDSGATPLVLGAGTREGVPYANGRTVTYVADDGARLFRVSLRSDVRLLAAGIGPGAARVVAALADGSVVTLSSGGDVLRTAAHDPSAVTAVALAPAGPIVQVGRTVRVGSGSYTLPARAVLLGFHRGRIVYANGSEVRARRIATGDDARLVSVALRPWERPLYSTDAWGSAWADGKTVAWRAGPL
jgi:hypothetical protein